MDLTEKLDLRGGRNCWSASQDEFETDAPPAEADVVVVGAGVMGAMVAERLTSSGRSVAVLDRRTPASGATAASTALVMWGADVPLTLLAGDIGMSEAAERWGRVFAAVVALDQLVKACGIACAWRSRPELYLAGDVLDRESLMWEGEVRRAAGLPSEFLDADEVSARFKIAARPALLSAGSYEVDPVALAKGLLNAARAQGARVSFPFDVERLSAELDRVRVHAGEVSVLARHVVIASGYEAARLFLPAQFALSSSFAIATGPGLAPAWSENALIWEASDPYLYARATVDGRIIVGGEDEDFADAGRRDALIPRKRAALEAKAAALLQRDDLEFDCAWAATFGASPDGLPALGPARNMDNVFLAYGYGGNGVTFASLGAEIIASAINGDAGAALFDPYRAAN